MIDPIFNRSVVRTMSRRHKTIIEGMDARMEESFEDAMRTAFP